MPVSILGDPEHWRTRAEEARTVAENLSNPELKRTMLRIASDYERLAKLLSCGRASNRNHRRAEKQTLAKAVNLRSPRLTVFVSSSRMLPSLLRALRRSRGSAYDRGGNRRQASKTTVIQPARQSRA